MITVKFEDDKLIIRGHATGYNDKINTTICSFVSIVTDYISLVSNEDIVVNKRGLFECYITQNNKQDINTIFGCLMLIIHKHPLAFNLGGKL